MNYQLIMLPNPIVVSDEKVPEEGLYLSEDYKVLIFTGRRVLGDELPKSCKKIIAGIEGLPTVNISLVADEIGWVDVEKLAKKEHEYNHRTVNEISFRLGVMVGFEAAQSLNEKKFSEEDLYKLLKLIGSKGYYVETDGSVYANAFNGGRIVNVVKEYTESLSKQEVYNVSIIQENNSITVTKILL